MSEMKKVMIAVPFILIFCLGQLFGQKNIFNIGVEGGTNLTFLHKNTTFLPFGQALGFTGGLSLQYNLSERIGIKTGINFERRVTTVRVDLTDANGQPDGVIIHNARFDYMIVPLMGKITWENKGKLYYVNAGPHLGYLSRQSNSNVHTYIDGYSRGELNHLDIGISTGIGAMFPINQNIYLTTEVRSNLGLRDMLTTDLTIKTNAVNLLAGIAYRL